MLKRSALGLCVLASAVSSAPARDWSTVPVIEHRSYQAVNADGSSAYGGGFPIRLIGRRKARTAVMNEHDIPGPANVSLADTEARRELLLLSRHSHQYGNAVIIDHDLQRLLHQNRVIEGFIMIPEDTVYGPGIMGNGFIFLRCIFRLQHGIPSLE